MKNIWDNLINTCNEMHKAHDNDIAKFLECEANKSGCIAPGLLQEMARRIRAGEYRDDVDQSSKTKKSS